MNKTTTNAVPKIGLIGLVLLIIVTIDSIRNLPATALFGPGLISLYVIAAIFLLIPGAIASSELTYGWPNLGGIYQWVSLGLGRKMGFIAVWGQWINTLIWFPTILSFVASSIAFVFAPEWGDNPYFLAIAALICFWGLTLLSLYGFKISARAAIFCSIFGLVIPMSFIIVLAILWLISGYPSHIELNAQSILPRFNSLQDWFSLISIMTSFLGFELVAVHITNLKDPQKNFPKAMGIAVVLILFTMIIGSLAIAIILPKDEIVIMHGVAQAFKAFLASYHLTYLLPILIILMALGSLGEMINWLTAPARGMFQASVDGFLPAKFHKKNKAGVETHILIIQACIVSIVCLIFIFLPTLNSAYWFLTNLSVEIYMAVYLLMFISAFLVEYKFPERLRLFHFLRHKSILNLIYIMGMVGCIATLIIGALPPPDIIIQSQARYQLLFWSGLALTFAPIGLIFYRLKPIESHITNK